MEEALHDTPLYCEFAGLDAGISRLPDESTILRFRHLLEEHILSLQLIANINDVTQGHRLLHGDETVVFAKAGYQGAAKRPEATGVDWHVAMRPGKRRALDKQTKLGALLDSAEQLKASVRAKVEPHQSHQVLVRFHQGSLQGPCQKHGTTGHAVCFKQFVDGQKANSSGSAGMSASAMRENARQRPVTAENQNDYAQEIGENALRVSSCEFLSLNSCFGGGCADTP